LSACCGKRDESPSLWGASKSKLLDSVAALPKTVIQALLAAAVIWALGSMGVGSWVRCTFFDTTGCLPKVGVIARKCQRVAPAAIDEVTQQYELLSHPALDTPATRSSYAWQEQNVEVTNIGLSGLEKVKFRYRPSDHIVGYSLRVRDTVIPLGVPNDADDWLALESEHFALAPQAGILGWIISSSETAFLWVLVATPPEHTHGWFEALCEGEKRCQLPFTRVRLPGC